MTAPIWLAAPPEVHSALLSSGPGPGPLLAASAAWRSLSTEYAAAAADLTAVLGAVQAGAWDGPAAAAYTAAHTPYLAWLMQTAADNAVTAVQQEIAAGAFTAALAAMPTLGELAANHATHAVLVGTNFFGINTIPIALNEADYGRMWIQAATVMSTYQAVSAAAMAAVVPAEPAPAVLKAQSLAADAVPPQPPDWFVQLTQFLEGLVPHPAYPNPGDFPLYAQLTEFFHQIGFTGISDPLAQFFAGLNGSAWLPPPGVPGSWLAWTGNPLSYLNPGYLAYILSVPLDPASYVAFTSIVILDDMLAILYTALFNPQALGLVSMLATIEMVGSVIGNTVQALNYLLTQTVLLPALLPMLAGSLALAPAGVLGGLGLGALAKLTPVIVAAPPPPVPAPFGAAAATAPVPSPAPSSVPPPSAPAPTPPPGSPPPSAPPPTPAGPPSATMPGLLYMAGDLGLGAQQSAGTGTRRRQEPEPESAADPAAATADQEQPGTRRRRRRAKAHQPGRGYEYMHLDQELDPPPRVAATDRHAGAAAGATGGGPAGLALLDNAAFGGSAAAPMLPNSWGR